MERLYIITALFLAVSCASPVPQQNAAAPGKPAAAEEKKIQTEVPAPVQNVKSGWADEDTYTVAVVAENVERARDAARHRILKDIVSVRYDKGSRYTDIAGIQDEFRKPLEEGRIVSERPVSGGIEIYYQINDKGLKKKFERK